ncbi:MAG: isomerase [marine bacterium B5-7]|nr:MAG: isomerase [marine bacterium B5-7]
MKTIRWYFDYVSPFAYLQMLQFDRLPSYVSIERIPVLFAGLLGHFGHKGPAEIPAKREQTYRYCQWYAKRHALPFRMPESHPFNPLVMLRETLRLGSTPEVVEAYFRTLFEHGILPEDARFNELCRDRYDVEYLPPPVYDDTVKLALRDNTEQAINLGIFGVPTFEVDGLLFWGVDSTEMVIEQLADPESFSRGEYRRLKNLPVGRARPGSDRSS